jgi:integrase/recombinase XerD
MLAVYRRHRSKCKFADDRISMKCRCALWAKGTLEGEPYQKSLKTRSFERAQQLVREIEEGKKPIADKPKIPTIEEAVTKFMADAEHGRKLTAGTLKKYRVLLDQLKKFSKDRHATKLASLDVDFAREFRASWKDGAISSTKKLERFRAFCKFCQTAGWMEKNPAISVSRPAAKTPPTLPLSEKEIEKTLTHTNDARWHALIQILRWSGLRIGDAMKLAKEKIDGNRLFLRTAKTGVPVYVPLPDFVVQELEALPLYGGFYFWNRAGESKIETATGNARRALRRIFKEAGVKHGHPHRFRDSFAVGLLEKGVPIETVSILLGHSDIRVTQRHYSPWVKSLQENLESAVRKTWQKPKLVRVK